MKSTTLRSLRVTAVAAVLAGGAWAGAASADDTPDQNGCTNASVYGLYMFATSGYNIVNGVPQPKAIMELIFLNGDGWLSVPAVTVSNNGAVVRPPANGTGTYAIARDCTGTLAFAPSGPTFDIFVVPGGAEIFMIQTQPNTVMQGRVVRVSP